MSERDGETKNQKALAFQERKGADDAHGKKDFDAAINHYTKAMEPDDEDISSINDRSTKYYHMGKVPLTSFCCPILTVILQCQSRSFMRVHIYLQYNECIENCKIAMKRGLELNSDVKQLAIALSIQGLAYVAVAQSVKDYDFAIEAFKMAHAKHRNSDLLKKIDESEELKKGLEQKADQKRELGNKCYGSQDYLESLKYYTEAIKLNPNDAKGYSNRAACYIKLFDLPEGLKDANKCLELDASFARGYVRKGEIQFLMREYNAALETYEAGLHHDKNNKELLEGISKCHAQILKADRDSVGNGASTERQTNPMEDPEIQSILTDPILRQVLMDIQGNPRDAHKQVKNPLVWKKLERLMDAGII